MTSNSSELLRLAETAARKAGIALMSWSPVSLDENPHRTHRLDVLSSNIIRECLAGSGIPILDEEDDNGVPENGIMWIIDPLDGSINAIVGSPDFAISIALVDDRNETKLGVVFAPKLDKLYAAIRGEGATVNGAPIPYKNVAANASLIAAYALPDDAAKQPRLHELFLSACIREGIILRQSGSAALDICRVGESVWDMFFEDGLYVWDYAAARLFVTEAGGSFDEQTLARIGKGGAKKFRVLALRKGVTLPTSLSEIMKLRPLKACP